MNRPARLALCSSLLACACGNGAPGRDAPLGSLVEQLASRDALLDARLRKDAEPWRVTAAGEIVTLEAPRGQTRISARLPQHADGPWEMSLGESHRLELSLRGASGAARAELDEKRAAYRGAYPSTDVVMVAGPDYVEQLLVLRDAGSPSSFTWDVRLPGKLDSARPDGKGGLEFQDDRGRALLRMPRPFAVDALGERREAELDWDGAAITVRLQRQGLAYPVLLDPVVEILAWQKLELSPSPGPLACLETTCVALRPREEGSWTWVFDGIRWTPKGTFIAPRQEGPMARYRDVVVMLAEGETWEWDGSNWQQRHPAISPALSSGELAARGDKLVFVGQEEGPVETWEWDGTDWSQRFPAHSPATVGSAAAYGDKVVLFNGQTWEWDGLDWTRRTTPDALHCNSSPTLAELHGKVVLFEWHAGTWVWDGSTWIERGDYPPSSSAMNHSPAPMRRIGDRLIMLVPADGERTLTWAWNGTSWSSVLGGPRISSCGSSVTMFAVAGRALLFEGRTDLVPSFSEARLFEWVDRGWRPNRSAVSPPSLFETAGAGQGGKLVLFGGSDGGDWAYADTWVWDGAAWTQQQVSPSPSGRYGHAMAADGDKVLLFGGSSGSAETWQWDGRAWTQKHPAVSPPPRSYAAMTGVNGKVLLYGGQAANEDWFADTWEWDGAEWTNRTGEHSPRSRAHPLLATVGNRAVLKGARGTWEWDGSGWNQTTTINPNTAEEVRSMAGSGDAVVLYSLGRTWVYRPIRVRGSDCTDHAQCLEGFCVDGFCCDRACRGQCVACDLPGSQGRCLYVTGTPRGLRPACTGTGSLCGGSCDGEHEESCVYPGGEIPCRGMSCGVGDVAIAAAECD
ncbi:MAG: hypothetical protein HY901_09680, partial [Deltaproteobacteria bacterium]|nr:hypothetical protein [Deltaproteobacteria bacterium]